MPDFFKDDQDKYQEDPMITMLGELKAMKEYLKRITEDVQRIRDDVNKMERKIK